MDDNIKFQISKKWLIHAGIQLALIILASITGFMIGHSRGPKVANLEGEPEQVNSGLSYGGTNAKAGSESKTSSRYDSLEQVSGSRSLDGADKVVSEPQDSENKIQDDSRQEVDQSAQKPGQYVASKIGKKYYPVGCKSADRIKPENQITFESSDQAERAGYEVSTQC
jgi:hypothetical protein